MSTHESNQHSLEEGKQDDKALKSSDFGHFIPHDRHHSPSKAYTQPEDKEIRIAQTHIRLRSDAPREPPQEVRNSVQSYGQDQGPTEAVVVTAKDVVLAKSNDYGGVVTVDISEAKASDFGEKSEPAPTSPASATSPSQPQLRAEPNPLCSSSIQFAEELRHDYEAMEAVTDYNGMYTISPKRDKFPEKYPAGSLFTQADYAERLRTLPIGMENIWLPLKRPAMHNRYHGFCRGAWQMRRTVSSSKSLPPH
jgi:hypothetical protein